MDLEGANVLQSQQIQRTIAATPAELRDDMKIGSLRGWRQVAKRHVVDHTVAQRAYRWCGIGHGAVSLEEVGLEQPNLPIRRQFLPTLTPHWSEPHGLDHRGLKI